MQKQHCFPEFQINLFSHSSPLPLNGAGLKIFGRLSRASLARFSSAGGYRRHSFLVYGQLVLVHRCYSAWPQVECLSWLCGTNSLGATDAFEGWASRVWYENVRVPASSIQLIFDQSRTRAPDDGSKFCHLELHGTVG
jgi:hypothetical protein